jgi:hypothetical protein
MQYLLTEEELKQLKRYDPNNLYNRLVTVLVNINTTHLRQDEKLKMFEALAVDVGDRAQDGYEEAMLDAWQSHFQ